MVTQSINLNLVPSGIPPRIKVSQYDTGAEAIEVTLLNGTEAYEIPADATVLLTGRTSGGQVFTKKATTASGSVATFGVIDAMTASAGTAKAEVEILDGQTVLGSANFDIYVEPSPVQKDNTAESDWSDLQTMANAVVAAGKKVDDAEQVVADATDVANKANEIITAIGDNVERSETAATSAEAAQTAAEAAQGKAESAQTAAETAEQSASASATTATTKATEAETNASAAAESADAAKAWAVGPSDELTAGTDTDNAKYYAAQAKASADKAEAISDVGIATTSTAGIVKPDGNTITIDGDGTIHGMSLLILKIKFSEEFKGKAYTVTGNGETFTGTVPNSLYINLHVHGLDSIYTVSAEYEGETYTSEVETKDFYGVYFGELAAWQATITVTVTDAVAGAVEGALVTATSTEKEYTRTTNAEGKAEIRVGKPGTYTIVAKNADGELTDTQEVVADTDKGTYTAEVSYWRATLTVTVTDKGVGVADAKVTAASADKTYGPVATDAEGKVTIKIGKAGTYTVTATNSAGEETNPKTVEVTTAGEAYTVTCTYTKIWAFLQNFADTNPDTTISYPEGYENSGFAKMHTNSGTGTVTAGDWGDFLVDTLKNLPYMVREDGVADYQLDPNDYTKKLDGTASDYNNLNYKGGAFAWLNKIYMKETYTGDTRLVEFADEALEGFTAVGFTDGENELEGYWIPMGYMDASGRVLVAGTTPVARKTCDQEWAIIQGKGSRSRFLGGPILNVLRDLEYMLFKSTDIQAHAGHGRCNAGSEAVVANAVVPNGAVPGWYGTSDRKTMNKYFHSQLLGSYQQLTRDPYTLLIGGKLYAERYYRYNLNATGKTDTGITWPTDNAWQYPSHLQYLGEGLGSFPKHENTGSSSTGLCDGVYGNASGTRVALRLGYANNALVDGPAYVDLDCEASNAYWGCGVGCALLPSAGYVPA